MSNFTDSSHKMQIRKEVPNLIISVIFTCYHHDLGYQARSTVYGLQCGNGPATFYSRNSKRRPRSKSIPSGGVWGGVGHLKAGGGGTLNPFGEDFRSAGFQWSEDLCNTDSDGDGRSTGVELGEPECV